MGSRRGPFAYLLIYTCFEAKTTFCRAENAVFLPGNDPNAILTARGNCWTAVLLPGNRAANHGTVRTCAGGIGSAWKCCYMLGIAFGALEMLKNECLCLMYMVEMGIKALFIYSLAYFDRLTQVFFLISFILKLARKRA